MTKYSHAIPITHKLPEGALWKYKHDLDAIRLLETSAVYVHSAQYMQEPSPRGGNIFKDFWWQYYEIPPPFLFKIITVDTAQKKNQWNDYTVFQCWGYFEGKIYLVDQFRDKVEYPELRTSINNFWNKHRVTYGGCRVIWVEDKVSGTGLIQDLKRKDKIPVNAIQRNVDKITRANDTVEYVQSGYVYLPFDAAFNFDFVEEHKKFTPLMTHKYDDQIDCTMDAIEILLIKQLFAGQITNNHVQPNQTIAPAINAKNLW